MICLQGKHSSHSVTCHGIYCPPTVPCVPGRDSVMLLVAAAAIEVDSVATDAALTSVSGAGEVSAHFPMV